MSLLPIRLRTGVMMVGAATILCGQAAAAPRVVADIAPVHAIVARVMEGVGTPEVLLPPGASPHDTALRPSQASRLGEADLVVWIGETLTPWLARPLESLSGRAQVLAAVEMEGVSLLPVRESAVFPEDPDAEQDHAETNEEKSSHEEQHHADGEHEAREEEMHEDEAHQAEAHGHAEHGHSGHGHGGQDPHLWLDPVNAAAIARSVAAALSDLDPANEALYRDNAAAFVEELDALTEEIAQEVQRIEAARFIVYHDAFQYFEHRFGLAALASIAAQEGVAPSVGRVQALRDLVEREDVTCAFTEPQFDPGLITTVTEGQQVRVGEIDPLGAALDPGPGLYPALLRAMSETMVDCLTK